MLTMPLEVVVVIRESSGRFVSRVCVRMRGGRPRTPFAERRQPIAKTYPSDVVTQPRMMGRRKPFRFVETACRDVDKSLRIAVLVGEGSSAGHAESTPNGRRRAELHRMAVQKLESRIWKCHPRDNWRGRDPSAGLTVTNHGVRWFPRDAVSNGTADAASFSDCRHVASISRKGRALARAASKRCTHLRS